VFTQDNTNTDNGDASSVNPDPEREASATLVTALGSPSVDFGDAPDTAAGPTAAPDAVTPADYETVPGRGPGHVVDGTTFLGTGVDIDPGAFSDPPPEDDGVRQGGAVLQGQTLVAGQSYTLDVETSLASGGLLNAWIDFNRDGVFDVSEQVATDAAPTANSITVTAPVPFSAAAGVTYARFRYSTAGGLTPTDSAPDGEVEDYEITIDGADPTLRLVKRVTRVGATDFTAFVDDGTPGNDDNSPNWPPDAPDPYLAGEVAAPAEPNEEVDYTIYFLSDGNTPVDNIQICDFVPDNTTYVTGSLVMNLGNAGDVALSDAADADDGENFAFGATPGAPCPAVGNTDGGIFVRIPGTADNATGPGAPASSFGYIQFTVRVD
ncbi:MAG: GEVED domain-containing protein, partial [Bacteroidota bacterium]